MCSAVEKLNTVEIPWDQQQHFCGPKWSTDHRLGKIIYFSNTGPLTAELFANVRDVLEEPDCPFCAEFNSGERHCILSETVHVSCRNLSYFINIFFFKCAVFVIQLSSIRMPGYTNPGRLVARATKFHAMGLIF